MQYTKNLAIIAITDPVTCFLCNEGVEIALKSAPPPAFEAAGLIEEETSCHRVDGKKGV
jgi:hypothetical protein